MLVCPRFSCCSCSLMGGWPQSMPSADTRPYCQGQQVCGGGVGGREGGEGGGEGRREREGEEGGRGRGERGVGEWGRLASFETDFRGLGRGECGCVCEGLSIHTLSWGCCCCCRAGGYVGYALTTAWDEGGGCRAAAAAGGGADAADPCHDGDSRPHSTAAAAVGGGPDGKVRSLQVRQQQDAQQVFVCPGVCKQ